MVSASPPTVERTSLLRAPCRCVAWMPASTCPPVCRRPTPRERTGAGAAMTHGPGTVETNAGGPGAGLLGSPGVDGAREDLLPEPECPRRRHLVIKRHEVVRPAGARGGPKVQSAAP